MSNEPDRSSTRLEALEAALLVVMRAMTKSDPDAYKHLIQGINKAIIDTDAANDIETKDPDRPSSRAAKDLKAIRDQFKAITSHPSTDQ